MISDDLTTLKALATKYSAFAAALTTAISTLEASEAAGTPVADPPKDPMVDSDGDRWRFDAEASALVWLKHERRFNDGKLQYRISNGEWRVARHIPTEWLDFYRQAWKHCTGETV